MSHNKIHEILIDISAKQGWDEASQIQHLTEALVHIMRPNVLVPVDMADMERFFRDYLTEIAEEEREAVCEKCGEACNYDPDECLCRACGGELESRFFA
jgi:Zn finger protein HypA/HybF involved in hydrogenase expression